MNVHHQRARSPVVGTSKPRLFKVLGPGLISGASDDDPVAIATYSQAGAKFGYALGWLSVLCFPIMAVVQEVSGRIGRTTGRGLAANIRPGCCSAVSCPCSAPTSSPSGPILGRWRTW